MSKDVATDCKNGYINDLSTIGDHDEVVRLRSKSKLDCHQEGVLLAVSGYDTDKSLPEGVSPRDVVLLSRYFKRQIGHGSTIGRTLDRFSAVALDNPDSYNAYASSLTHAIHWNKYDDEAIAWRERAYEAGDMEACYDLALMLCHKDPHRSLALYKEFLQGCRDSEQYNNNDARFERLYDFHYICALEAVLYIVSDPNKEDIYDRETAKKAAREVVELAQPIRRSFQFIFAPFAEHLLRTENDDGGFRLLLGIANRLDPDENGQGGFHPEARVEVLRHMRCLDEQNNGVISRILEDDESGEFSIFAKAYQEESNQISAQQLDRGGANPC